MQKCVLHNESIEFHCARSHNAITEGGVIRVLSVQAVPVHSTMPAASRQSLRLNVSLCIAKSAAPSSFSNAVRPARVSMGGSAFERG